MSALRNLTETAGFQTYLRVYRTPIVATCLALMFVTTVVTVAAQTIRRPTKPRIETPTIVAEVIAPSIPDVVFRPEPAAPKEEAPVEAVKAPDAPKAEPPAKRRAAEARKRNKPHAKPDTPPKVEEPVRTVKPAEPPPENHGTAVRFVGFPDLASLQARREDKLVFILHVSGNFEDPGFT